MRRKMNIAEILLGIAFIVFGAISILDARRIGSTIRMRGTLDIVGPDGYLLGVGVLLVAIGLVVIVTSWRRSARSLASDASDVDAEGGNAHLALTAALLVYAIVMPIAGYVASTFLFVLAVFRIMAVRSWTRAIVGALVLTALFYGAFTRVADLPLPRGWHGLG